MSIPNAGWNRYKKMSEAVAADTAIVNENIMRKMLMLRSRMLPSTARPSAITRVAGTV